MIKQEEMTNVKELCEKIGYARVMELTSLLWQEDLILKDKPTAMAQVPCKVGKSHIRVNDKVYVDYEKTCHFWKFMLKLVKSDGYNINIEENLGKFNKYVGIRDKSKQI